MVVVLWQVFSATSGKSKCSYALSGVLFLWTVNKYSAFGARNNIAGYEDEFFKTHKTRKVPEKPGGIEFLATPHTSQFTVNHCPDVPFCVA